ncbi:hypothetical protein [Mycolicibacterium sphagni]|uniref:Uncharacterized protein n=1 Tax=Mycolicibacterium sphagni TaxID=1786 RepID=A0A255DL31_9MYCO|nr:hypothetical protein [Mycolicibacterium sphagni]OYN77672.1 hypothetical protein CG716_17410 [Mycolicibacterium sphagni]
MRDIVIRGLIDAEGALSGAAFNVSAHGWQLSAADLQDLQEHIEEIDDLLLALQLAITEPYGLSGKHSLPLRRTGATL